MKKQTNANGHTSEMTYDGLGRMKTRIDKFVGGGTDTSSTWTYYTSPEGLGKLDSVLDGQAGFAKAVLYDSLGRIDEVITNFDGGAYFEKTTYDLYGRVCGEFLISGKIQCDVTSLLIASYMGQSAAVLVDNVAFRR